MKHTGAASLYRFPSVSKFLALLVISRSGLDVTVAALICFEFYTHEFRLRRVNVQFGSPRRAISLSLRFTQAFAFAFFGWLVAVGLREAGALKNAAEKCSSSSSDIWLGQRFDSISTRGGILLHKASTISGETICGEIS